MNPLANPCLARVRASIQQVKHRQHVCEETVIPLAGEGDIVFVQFGDGVLGVGSSSHSSKRRPWRVIAVVALVVEGRGATLIVGRDYAPTRGRSYGAN